MKPIEKYIQFAIDNGYNDLYKFSDIPVDRIKLEFVWVEKFRLKNICNKETITEYIIIAITSKGFIEAVERWYIKTKWSWDWEWFFKIDWRTIISGDI